MTWNDTQWEAAVIHLLGCDLPVDECRFCTAISWHVTNEKVTEQLPTISASRNSSINDI